MGSCQVDRRDVSPSLYVGWTSRANTSEDHRHGSIHHFRQYYLLVYIGEHGKDTDIIKPSTTFIKKKKRIEKRTFALATFCIRHRHFEPVS